MSAADADDAGGIERLADDELRRDDDLRVSMRCSARRHSWLNQLMVSARQIVDVGNVETHGLKRGKKKAVKIVGPSDTIIQR